MAKTIEKVVKKVVGKVEDIDFINTGLETPSKEIYVNRGNREVIITIQGTYTLDFETEAKAKSFAQKIYHEGEESSVEVVGNQIVLKVVDNDNVYDVIRVKCASSVLANKLVKHFRKQYVEANNARLAAKEKADEQRLAREKAVYDEAVRKDQEEARLAKEREKIAKAKAKEAKKRQNMETAKQIKQERESGIKF